MKRLLACLVLITLLAGLCPAGFAQEEPAAYEPLQYGSQGETVTVIQ